MRCCPLYVPVPALVSLLSCSVSAPPQPVYEYGGFTPRFDFPRPFEHSHQPYARPETSPVPPATTWAYNEYNADTAAQAPNTWTDSSYEQISDDHNFAPSTIGQQPHAAWASTSVNNATEELNTALPTASYVYSDLTEQRVPGDYSAPASLRLPLLVTILIAHNICATVLVLLRCCTIRVWIPTTSTER